MSATQMAPTRISNTRMANNLQRSPSRISNRNRLPNIPSSEAKSGCSRIKWTIRMNDRSVKLMTNHSDGPERTKKIVNRNKTTSANAEIEPSTEQDGRRCV